MNENIIRLCYAVDDDMNYIFDFVYFCDFIDYIKDNQWDMFKYIVDHPRMINLLYSKYTGKRYNPKRFDKNLIIW